VSVAIRRYEVPCRPPFWARGGHAQTLLGHLLPSPGKRIVRGRDIGEREVRIPDGDRLVVYELSGTSGVRVHLFHGLSGDVNSEYMRRTAAVLGARGHEVWAANHRGCGTGRGLAARPYHSGRTEDLQAVLAASRRDAPDRLHLLIGFSLGGNAALLLAAQQLDPLPDGIVAVNPPVDLERSSVDIGRGLCRVYEMRFMWRLRRAVAERARLGLSSKRYDISLQTSLIDFDDMFTAPECGFESGRDYYRRCSSLPRLADVRTPSVIVTAADDPFVDPAAYRDAEPSADVFLHVEPTGGHVGYVTRGGLVWRRWLDGALAHYVDELVRLRRSRQESAQE